MKIEHPYLQSVADNDRQRPWGDTEDSTMSEKTITRYRLCNDVHADRYERDAAQQYWDVLKNQTDVVLARDHEAALAAEREHYSKDIADLNEIHREHLAAKDARIAELELLVYVPGLWRCAKCDCGVTSTLLCANTGAMAANTEPQQCPNGCGPLWRVTERDAGNRLVKDMERVCDERNAIRDAIEAKAAEWADSYVPDGYSEVSDEDYGKRQMCEEHAAELRALLGDVK